MRAASVGKRFKQAASLVGLIAFAAVSHYLVQNVEMLIVFSSIVGNHNEVEDSIKNDRGDEVNATTKGSGRWHDPDKTAIRLRRAHDWFWTTLIETESFGVREDLNWRDDDALDVTLGFGCLTQVMQRVERVGSISIYYQFSDRDTALAKGCPD